MMRRSALILPLMASLLTGCSFIPFYETPEAPVPETWPQRVMGEETSLAPAGAATISDLDWRQVFDDPVLRQLIDQALINNRDLRVAALNIERARAQYQITEAGQFPTIQAASSFNRQRTPASMISDTAPKAQTASAYEATIGFSQYELDFFGRIDSLEQAALEQYLATVEASRSAQISLIAEVASAYLTLAADQQRLRLAQETVESQQESYELTQNLVEGGAASALDLRQAQTSVEIARADVAAYSAQVEQDRNALRALVGSTYMPEVGDAELTAVTIDEDVPVGLPSEVLQQRPDILQAERQLRAANANIGAARAAFYPSITLTANAGLASRELSDLFMGSSRTWSLLPQINLPIFDGGERRANLEVSRADRAIALAQYEGTIQTAFREVADALAVRANIDEQLEAQSALVEAAEESYRLSDARFRGGVDDYLAVLDSQRQLYSAQQSLITARLRKFVNLATLYRALGGGWSMPQQAPAATATPVAAPGVDGATATVTPAGDRVVTIPVY